MYICKIICVFCVYIIIVYRQLLDSDVEKCSGKCIRLFVGLCSVLMHDSDHFDLWKYESIIFDMSIFLQRSCLYNLKLDELSSCHFFSSEFLVRGPFFCCILTVVSAAEIFRIRSISQGGFSIEHRSHLDPFGCFLACLVLSCLQFRLSTGWKSARRVTNIVAKTWFVMSALRLLPPFSGAFFKISLLNSKHMFPHHPGFKHGAFLAFRHAGRLSRSMKRKASRIALSVRCLADMMGIWWRCSGTIWSM